jgi:uncharacterized metal-binding protein
MIEKKKVALAACSGMSPYGLVARVTSTDLVAENDNIVSICMVATAADKEGFITLIKKYPIITLNGCDSNCTIKILEQKGVKVTKNINVFEELDKKNLKPEDVSRLDSEGEVCVEYLKKKIKKDVLG